MLSMCLFVPQAIMADTYAKFQGQVSSDGGVGAIRPGYWAALQFVPSAAPPSPVVPDTTTSGARPFVSIWTDAELQIWAERWVS